jgi:carbon-monoxide dehydrogenase medium subunit
MREFDFVEPASVAEACALLQRLGEDARAWAGGTALILAMRQRMLAPTHVVSLGRLPELRGIHFDAQQGLRIGALTRHADVAASAQVQRHYPMLAHMASRMANPQVRNQGTLGGNLCYADPATDPPTCLMALGASVVLEGPDGQRTLALEDFLVDYYTTALEPGEIVLALQVPPPVPGDDGRYTRFLRTAAEHRPLVNVGLHVRREGSLCHAARLVVGACVVVPSRQPAAEALLAGKTVTPALAADVARQVAQDIEPLSDLRGDANHRRAMVEVVTRRTLHDLFGLPAVA